jgi:hypothetical protein
MTYKGVRHGPREVIQRFEAGRSDDMLAVAVERRSEPGPRFSMAPAPAGRSWALDQLDEGLLMLVDLPSGVDLS